MAGPKPTTRAGSGLTIRKNSAAVSVGRSVRDLDFIEGAGILLTLTHDRELGITRVTVTATGGPLSDRDVGITGADTLPAELNTKLVVTAPISKVVENAGADERLRISHGGQHNFTDLLGVISDAQHGTRSGDLHPIYLTTAEADALYEVLGTVATHEAAGNPHAVYLTQTEADALYEALGAVATHTAIAAAHHTNANDPSAGEKAALPGTSGTPGAGNKYVTNADSRNTDDRTPLAHGSAKHTGKIGEVPFILPIPLAQPLASGTLQAAVDYEHRDWGNGVVRINRIYARARSNVSGDVTLKLHRNGAATHADDTVTISSGTRESSVTTLNAEITLADGDYLDIEQTTAVTDDVAVDFYVLGDQDVVAAV